MVKGNFLVYKSSAGSGKTFTLVKEYLKIVLRDTEAVKNILAITFTNAAAAEMKERIIKELSNIIEFGQQTVNKTPEGMMAQIIKDWENEGFSVPNNEWIVGQADRARKKILHQYADFSVSTIDSFMHRVVRTFAFDLDLPMRFEVELDTESLLRLAVDKLISSVGADRKLTQLLVTYILNQTDEEKDIRLENLIVEMAKTLTDEESAPYIRKIKGLNTEDFEEIAKTLKQSIATFEQKIENEATEAMALITRNGLVASDFYYTTKGIFGYFKQLAAGNVREKIHPNKSVLKAIEQNQWNSKKICSEAKTKMDSIQGELERHYNAIQSLSTSDFGKYLTHKAVLSNIYPVAVLNQVELLLEEIKTDNVLLHISDFNKRIAGIVREEPVPFIYERLGERYRHYMIDEFQDTSALQWENLLPLLVNGLATGDKSLIVGDGKQAIYRFRNGDVEQFANLPKLGKEIQSVSKPEWEASLNHSCKINVLEDNWRSAKAIVTFNNDFFGFTQKHLANYIQPIYDDLEQNPVKKDLSGYVEVTFREEEEWIPADEQMLEQVLDAINRCHEAGHPYSDITVLCRKHKEGSMLARGLLSHDIPVISAESLLLSQAKEVNFFLSIIRLLDNPFDKIAAVEMLEYLLSNNFINNPDNLHGCLTTTGISQNRHKKPENPLLASIENLLRKNGIDFAFDRFLHQNIYDTCETILRRFFSGQESLNPFVSFFMDAIFDYESGQMLSYADFLSWWEEKGKSYSVVVPEGVNAAQVMTIHKSKGLQFPIVIHPFADQAVKQPTKAGFWIQGEEAEIPALPATWLKMTKGSLEGTPFQPTIDEELEKSFLDLINTTYVAFTRPSQKLFVFFQKEKRKPKNSIGTLLQEHLEEKGMWQENRFTYSFGLFEEARDKTDESPEAASSFKKLISNPWTKKMRMRSHNIERGILFNRHDALERGNLLHRAMEEIRSTEDVDPVLQNMLDKGEITGEIKTEWTGKINAMIRHPEVEACFKPGVTIKTEPGLFDQNGSFFRPDRVVFLDNECVVIDYKTGMVYDHHRQQMNTYAYLLKSIGYPKIRKIILYLDQGKSETV